MSSNTTTVTTTDDGSSYHEFIQKLRYATTKKIVKVGDLILWGLESDFLLHILLHNSVASGWELSSVIAYVTISEGELWSDGVTHVSLVSNIDNNIQQNDPTGKKTGITQLHSGDSNENFIGFHQADAAQYSSRPRSVKIIRMAGSDMTKMDLNSQAKLRTALDNIRNKYITDKIRQRGAPYNFFQLIQFGFGTILANANDSAMSSWKMWIIKGLMKFITWSKIIKPATTYDHFFCSQAVGQMCYQLNKMTEGIKNVERFSPYQIITKLGHSIYIDAYKRAHTDGPFDGTDFISHKQHHIDRTDDHPLLGTDSDNSNNDFTPKKILPRSLDELCAYITIIQAQNLDNSNELVKNIIINYANGYSSDNNHTLGLSAGDNNASTSSSTSYIITDNEINEILQDIGQVAHITSVSEPQPPHLLNSNVIQPTSGVESDTSATPSHDDTLYQNLINLSSLINVPKSLEQLDVHNTISTAIAMFPAITDFDQDMLQDFALEERQEQMKQVALRIKHGDNYHRYLYNFDNHVGNNNNNNNNNSDSGDHHDNIQPRAPSGYHTITSSTEVDGFLVLRKNTIGSSLMQRPQSFNVHHIDDLDNISNANSVNNDDDDDNIIPTPQGGDDHDNYDDIQEDIITTISTIPMSNLTKLSQDLKDDKTLLDIILDWFVAPFIDNIYADIAACLPNISDSAELQRISKKYKNRQEFLTELQNRTGVKDISLYLRENCRRTSKLEFPLLPELEIMKQVYTNIFGYIAPVDYFNANNESKDIITVVDMWKFPQKYPEMIKPPSRKPTPKPTSPQPTTRTTTPREEERDDEKMDPYEPNGKCEIQ